MQIPEFMVSERQKTSLIFTSLVHASSPVRNATECNNSNGKASVSSTSDHPTSTSSLADLQWTVSDDCSGKIVKKS